MPGGNLPVYLKQTRKDLKNQFFRSLLEGQYGLNIHIGFGITKGGHLLPELAFNLFINLY